MPPFEACLKLPLPEIPEKERLALVSRLLETVPNEPAGLSLDGPGLIEQLQRRTTDTEGSVPWSRLRDQL